MINNAGALFSRRVETEDGLELTFATNHLSYFVLTHLLRDRLLASVPARVINTASDAHRGARLNFDDLQLKNGYRGFRAYSRSKLCNILFTRELARRMAGTGVTANSLHPGFVATRFGDEGGKGFSSHLFQVLKKFALSPEKGAETIIYLASSDVPAVVSGAYFTKCRVVTPSSAAQDDQAALLSRLGFRGRHTGLARARRTRFTGPRLLSRGDRLGGGFDFDFRRIHFVR